jgi:hypothetical protein
MYIVHNSITKEKTWTSIPDPIVFLPSFSVNHKPPSISEWLGAHLNTGDLVGVDPRLMSVQKYQHYEKVFAAQNISFVPLMTNLIDLIWTEGRPEIKRSHLLILDLKYTGKQFHASDLMPLPLPLCIW